MNAVSVMQMKNIEKLAIGNLEIPALLLMENAALRASDVCMKRLDGMKAPRVIIFAGTGNNGGDGFGIARHLHVKGICVEIAVTGSINSLTGDAYVNMNIAKNLGIMISELSDNGVSEDALMNLAETIENCDLVVDAMLGIGLTRSLDGIIASAAKMINSLAKYVIAIDVPTGIDSDTGKVAGIAVKADKTVTFGLPKQGLFLFPAAYYTGEIEIADICIPEEIAVQAGPLTRIIDDSTAGGMLPLRAARSNKGSYGKTFVLAGSNEMPGAASLTAQAAYRTGAGIVRVCTTSNAADKIKCMMPEAVFKCLPDTNGFLCRESYECLKEQLIQADVVLLGPGLGQGADIDEFVGNIIENCEARMVLDADALNSVAKRPEILNSLRKPAVITPHPGEMSRLTGRAVTEILDDTIAAAREFAEKYGVITVLKDARTIIAAPSGETYINISGSPSMAKAGAGDVLTGIIGGLISQGMDSLQAAALGCYIHGKAGEIAGAKLSDYSVLASDIIDSIADAIKEYCI